MGQELAKIETFRAELAKAETFQEISYLKSQAEAVAEFAKRLKLGKEKQDEIGVFLIEIETKKGEWLDKHFPSRVNTNKRAGTEEVPAQTIKDIGVTKNQSSQARLIAKEPELVQKAIETIKASDNQVVTPNAVVTEIKKIIREKDLEKQKNQIENNELPNIRGEYDIISIDPPWNYGRKYDPNGSRVANPYPEMNTDEIKKLKLPFKKDSICFLWTTHKFLPDAFEILKQWEFEYKATMVWNKLNIGMGSWFRMQCEFCLVGIKGKPYWNNIKFSEIIEEKRREHSRKPEKFYQLVNEICAGSKLEYFSREKREGWDIFGNDINKF